ESKVKTDSAKIKHQPDGSYYNSGSCVHPLSITGLEIDFEKGLRVSLIQWQYGIEGNKLAIRKIGIA
ncbi:MAG: hypothetical protein WCK00_03910, partial [Deltaproteobacteria bacterium]